MSERNRERDIDPDVRKAIAVLFDEGMRAREKFPAAYIGRKLRDDRRFVHLKERLPEIRAFQRFVKAMMDRVVRFPEKIKELEKPFEWHRLEEYDLPWEASAYLLELWRFALGRDPYSIEDTAIALPSAREVRWWWRVHLADPDLDMFSVLSLAKAIEVRETIHDLLDMPMELADLEALLAYKPWRDHERLQVYLRGH